ncbi:hypothetical protein [Sinobaca sp. H24]|uniref:hypothetical protein n=1 Tax=Sinobaca sp. H24 TaxID=2923376 RepID=UPI00207A6168|nr:hypothetical protein [Sinobaca sp. H24]
MRDFITCHPVEKLNSDLFETRLMGQKVVCMAGEEAARIFYDNDKFKRKGAMPKPLKVSLLGENGVHEQDEEMHKQRKRMFLSMMTPDRVEEMKNIAVRTLDVQADRWEHKNNVTLFSEIQEILTRAGCEWAGVPLYETEVKQRTDELVEMIDSFDGSFKRAVKGKKARDSNEEWLMDIIQSIRSGKYSPSPNTPAYIIAHHREPDGKYLKTHTAAVELNNSFRPLVATANFIVFGLLALYEHPEVLHKLKERQE